MYIYELPFEINKELCRLLDDDDDWKELAGNHMRYSTFDLNEIEQTANRLATSPTNQLLIRWGQLNHRVEELFILLYRMKHIPALRCLVPVVDAKFQRLLNKHEKNNSNIKQVTALIDDAHRNKIQKLNSNDSDIPLPVMLIGMGVHIPTSSKYKFNGISPATESNTEEMVDTSSTQGAKSNDINSNNEFLRNISAIPMISYTDLKEATNNWSDSNLLGKGGYGQVYKGEWKLLPVAVKRLKENDGKNRELISEMCLNHYRHDNILPLYGYSLGGPEACLVYQLMAGGSLERRLRTNSKYPPLTWCQRYRVAHGVARGLQYLHTMTGTPLIHGDIKPANILLDQCTMPKIGDFGLARKGPFGEDRTDFKVSRVHGTRAYLPDEYLRSRCLSPAVDVFSFGVVLLELATALPAQEQARAQPLLTQYIAHLCTLLPPSELEDSVLRNTPNSNPQLCVEFINIGVHCTKYFRRERPTMLEVYKRLDALDVPGKQFT